MTVAELIKALEQYPPGRDVFVAIEDRLEMVYFVELVLERSNFDQCPVNTPVVCVRGPIYAD
jgi:hypothetical protein